MLFLYPAQIAVDFDTGMPVIDRRSQVGQVVRSGTPSTVPTIYEDQAGTIIIPAAQRTATDQGMVAPFYVDESFGPVSWYSDGVEYPLVSVEGVDKRLSEALIVVAAALVEAQAVRQAVESSPSIIPPGNQGDIPYYDATRGQYVPAPPPAGGSGGTGITGAPSVWPSTFPAAEHTHTASQVGASPLGQTLMTAADAQAARVAIGAGVPVTGFPGFGTTATTAAPGNHAHAQYVDAAQARAIADQSVAAAGGGGGGASTTYVWTWANGDYPALPLSKPAGWTYADILARGPVVPSTFPSWVGSGAGKVPIDYRYRAAS